MPLPLLLALMGVAPLPEGEDATAVHLNALQAILVHVSLIICDDASLETAEVFFWIMTVIPHVLLCASVRKSRQAEHISEHAELRNNMQNVERDGQLSCCDT